MIISFVAAMDRNRLIGNKNQLPWHLPADFAHFKSVTMGKPILMGRKTFESIGKPLPGRQNIVLSRSPDLKLDGINVVNSIDEAMLVATGEDEIMVIGGSAVYQMLLPRVNQMYLTYIDAEFEGDAWFPQFNEAEWTVTESVLREADDKNKYDCRFVTYQRK